MSTTIAPIEVPNLNRRVHRVTVDFYHQLAELGMVKKRTELIRGVIVNKMSKSPLHSSLLRRLARLLAAVLPPSHLLLQDDPLTLADSEPEPDVSIVRGAEDDFVAKHPTTADLVVEVAVTSLADDRSLATIYAEAGVGEYWIVLGREKCIEVYRNPDSGVYRTKEVAAAGETLVCQTVPGVSIDLDELFAGSKTE